MASDSVTLAFRYIMIEDLGAGSYSTLAQVNLPVLNVGSSVPLTPVLTFANDSAAETAGLVAGDVYIENGIFPIRLHAVAGGSSGPTKITGSTTQTPGTLTDGTTLLVATFTVTGALLGDAIYCGSSPALPTGVQAVAKVSSAGNVNIEVWNFSGLPQTIGSTTFNIVIFH